MREATDKEIDEYKRIRIEIEKEDKIFETPRSSKLLDINPPLGYNKNVRFVTIPKLPEYSGSQIGSLSLRRKQQE